MVESAIIDGDDKAWSGLRNSASRTYMSGERIWSQNHFHYWAFKHLCDQHFLADSLVSCVLVVLSVAVGGNDVAAAPW
jgi:hypothetical protein